MTQRELSELKRRLNVEKSSITKIYGCFVNKNKEVISDIEESLGTIPQSEAEKYLALFKRSLSGSFGKNLLDIAFSTNDVMQGENHRLLMELHEKMLSDAEKRTEFFKKIIETVRFEDSNYLILMAHDAYDVRSKNKNGEFDEDSETVYSYMICCICPVSDGKSELSYSLSDSHFHSYMSPQTVEAPEYGFIFPAFDGRRANIYNALYYAKNQKEINGELIEKLFGTQCPMSAPEQKENFGTALAESLTDECEFEVVRAVHEGIREKIALHKESRDPEPLDFSSGDVEGMLKDSGIGEEKIQVFHESMAKSFGKGASLDANNIIDTKKFELVTPQVKISVDPAFTSLVEVRVIDGKKYILIPAETGVTLNGLNVFIPEDEKNENP